ncbi:MAG: T9SS type A sorting domain-containing protein, partial [Cyclobacteriaceae bacterium]
SSPYRPSLDIHHVDDAVVPCQEDYPFNGGRFPIASIATAAQGIIEIDKLHGGCAMESSAGSSGFELLTLEGENQGGMAGMASYHNPQLKFGTNYDDYLNNNIVELEDTIMYYVDAFFTKDWTTGTTTSRHASSSGEVEEVKEEPIREEPVFNIFPNPATDEVNVIVNVLQSDPLDLQIIDLQGRTVYQMQRDQVREGTQWIRLGDLNLPSGMYVLQLITNGVERSERLVIKN